MVPEDKKEHCTFIDNVLHCTACGSKKTLKLPLEVRDFTLKCKQFINAHEKCVENIVATSQK